MLIDLRHLLPVVRDQKQRGTCISFATSDAHSSVRAGAIALSVDYLHFHAVRRMGLPISEGATGPSVRQALALDGQPLETAYPYSEQLPVGNWQPPSKLAPLWRATSSLLASSPSAALADVLEKGVPAVLTFRMSSSFRSPDPKTYVVSDDHKGVAGKHAVVIVGVREEAGARIFLARNSWGTLWGDAGHAWVPALYIDNRTIEVFRIVESQEVRA